MKWKILAVVALVIGLISPVPASAVVNLTYDDTLKDIQQTDNNPCVIGSPSCSSGDVIPFTSVPGGPGDQDLNSPTYTVGQLATAVGSTATNLLIDVNQACGDPSCPIILDLVEVFVNGVLEFQFLGDQAVPLVGSFTGNGFSDAGVKTLDFSKFANTANVVFHIKWNNNSDGQESFLLAATMAIPTTPEPSTLILLGSGLVLVGAMARRRFRRS